MGRGTSNTAPGLEGVLEVVSQPVSLDFVADRAALTEAKPASIQSEKSKVSIGVPDWRIQYRRRVVVSDVIVVVVAVAAGQIIRFSPATSVRHLGLSLYYSTLSAVLIACWLSSLAIVGAWHRKIVGSGSPAYSRVAKASFVVFGLLAVVAYLGKLDIARGYVAIAIPVGACALLIERIAWHARLLHYRRRGEMTCRTLVVGGATSAAELARQLDLEPLAGYEVVGLCVPTAIATRALDGFPVVGNLGEIVETARRLNASTIAIAKTDAFPPSEVRRLAWNLETTQLELVIAPMLTDIAGPRIHAEPVPGLPLVHLERPRLRGPELWLKTAFDLTSAAIGLVLLAPLFAAIAIAIKVDDGGPVFFRQTRVGVSQKPFRIWKFRTMVVDAEQRKEAERKLAGQSNAVFFKAAGDSRVTRVGSVLRRTSLDELPQLFNVLALQMSLVGPRPLVPGEGKEVEHYISRRALVKPGVTGLWQVSGRSNVGDEQRARLDLLYVENWSFFGDLGIVFRTVRTVIGQRGAV